MSYASDLTRLAVSGWLAIWTDNLAVSRKAVCEAIQEGYASGLESSGEPFVLSERRRWLRLAVTSRFRDPAEFFKTTQRGPTKKAS